MLKLLQVDIQDREKANDRIKTLFISNFFLAAVFSIAVSPVFVMIKSWLYLAFTLLLVVVGLALFLSKFIRIEKRFSMLMVLFITCLMSSIIISSRGVLATGWDAVFNVAVPWFLWDIIYCVCGLQLLSYVDTEDYGNDIQFGKTETIGPGSYWIGKLIT